MKLQCRWCEKLALNHSGDGISTDRLEKILFIYLVKGMIEGCAGCRLVCECLPLLNDYCTGSGEPSGLFVHADFLETNDSHSEAPWCLSFAERIAGNRWDWIGEFELCKTTRKQDI